MKSFKRGDRRYQSNKIRKKRICDVINHWGLKGEFGWAAASQDSWLGPLIQYHHNIAVSHHPNIGQGTNENDGYRIGVPRRRELRRDFSDGDIGREPDCSESDILEEEWERDYLNDFWDDGWWDDDHECYDPPDSYDQYPEDLEVITDDDYLYGWSMD